MINNKFVYFKNYNTFQQKLEEIKPESIVFIEDINAIYTHERFFYCSNNAFLDSLGDYATKDFVSGKLSELVGDAPEALDTLKEIADKLGENDNNITDILNSIDANREKLAEIEEELSNKLEKGNYVPYNLNSENRKIITLDNSSLINARSNNEELENKVEVNGRAISLIQLNKWNVVDLGSPYTLLNMNVPKGVRPTVQEAGLSGPDANKIAYLSDIESINSDVNSVKTSLDNLNSEFTWAEL